MYLSFSNYSMILPFCQLRFEIVLRVANEPVYRISTQRLPGYLKKTAIFRQLFQIALFSVFKYFQFLMPVFSILCVWERSAPGDSRNASPAFIKSHTKSRYGALRISSFLLFGFIFPAPCPCFSLSACFGSSALPFPGNWLTSCVWTAFSLCLAAWRQTP